MTRCANDFQRLAAERTRLWLELQLGHDLATAGRVRAITRLLNGHAVEIARGAWPGMLSGDGGLFGQRRPERARRDKRRILPAISFENPDGSWTNLEVFVTEPAGGFNYGRSRVWSESNDDGGMGRVRGAPLSVDGARAAEFLATPGWYITKASTGTPQGRPGPIRTSALTESLIRERAAAAAGAVALSKLAAAAGRQTRGRVSAQRQEARNVLARVVAELRDCPNPVNADALARLFGVKNHTIYRLQDAGRSQMQNNSPKEGGVDTYWGFRGWECRVDPSDKAARAPHYRVFSPPLKKTSNIRKEPAWSADTLTKAA